MTATMLLSIVTICLLPAIVVRFSKNASSVGWEKKEDMISSAACADKAQQHVFLELDRVLLPQVKLHAVRSEDTVERLVVSCELALLSSSFCTHRNNRQRTQQHLSCHSFPLLAGQTQRQTLYSTDRIFLSSGCYRHDPQTSSLEGVVVVSGGTMWFRSSSRAAILLMLLSD
jgi:hypothetical protein